MYLTLYKTEDSENTINKTLTEPLVIEFNFKERVTLENPEIVLSNITNVDFSEYNYGFIDKFNAFYFIRDVVKVNYHLTRLVFEIDYLETYKADIISSVGSYRKVLETGDYGQLQLTTTGEQIVSEIESSVSLVPTNDKILTVLRWAL